MPQHFIKIEIKGDPKNLPQDFGIYNAQYKGDDFVSKVLYYPPYSENFWLRFIEWYEIPATESIQKSEDIYYKRVDIKGENDLPKPGTYFVAEKDYKYLYLCSIDNSAHIKRIWLRDIDWYLLPVPEPQQPEQSESKILKTELCTLFEMHGVVPMTRLGMDGLIDDVLDVFGSQSHNNTVGPSEEMIEKESHKVIMNHLTDNSGEFIQSTIGADDKRIWWIKGAKYALSQCKSIDSKQIEKQLLDRLGFTDGVVNAENQVKIFSFIDWLKSPENK